MNILREFKTSFLFLAKFLAFYILGNVIYGLYIESYGDKADHITAFVAKQSANLLNILGSHVNTMYDVGRSTVSMIEDDNTYVKVFEGCNGVNVMIIFVAFLLAFGGPTKKLVWFMPVGLVIIHLANLMRLDLLYVIARDHKDYFYFVHKYLFTAILYLIIFGLWAIWVIKYNGKRDVKATN